jgi:flagellar basal-body rod protein FlgF
VGSLQEISAAGLLRQENRFNIIANNLSNTQTTGFKRDTLAFQEILSQTADRNKNYGAENSVTVFQQGGLQSTGNELNLALEGEGFFKIKTPAGIRYTRNGEFQVNQDKVLVQGDGFPVLGQRGEISLNGTHIVVGTDGAIQVDGAEVDKIAKVTFPDMTLLKKEGQTLLGLEGEQEEREATQTQVIQGALEQSNVNALEEMVLMMDALRSYEAFMKLMQANDEMDSKVVNEMGKA